jgi:CHAD domain-containing protein
MAYRIKNPADVPGELRRLASEQVHSALGALVGLELGAPGAADAVHAARKSIKKARAVVRLGAGGVPGKARRAADVALRDAGRSIAGTRDADVMIATVDALSVSASDHAQESAPLWAEVRGVLVEARDNRLRGLHGDPTPLGAACCLLNGALEGIQSWDVDGRGFEILRPGLKGTYRDGRRALRATGEELTAEAMHEWRKRVKDHWYHLRVLRPLWPRVLKPSAGQASRLAELLGCDHDLAVLVATVEEGPFDALAVREVTQRAVLRQAVLRRKALPLGARLYAERPSPFADRIQAWWDAWAA